VDKPSAGRADGLLLAGNVGGTKTVLEIVSEDPGLGRPLAVKTYPSGAYPGPDAIAHEFLFSVRADRHRPGPYQGHRRGRSGPRIGLGALY
jgi:glucokinase